MSIRRLAEYAILAVLAVSIAEFHVKLLWPWGGASIAVCAALMLPLWGARDLRRTPYLLIALFALLILISYGVNLDAIAGTRRPGFQAANELVILAAFLAFVSADIPPAGLSRIAAAICLGAAWAVGIGWLRFFTGAGGLVSEHALGYWGVQYDVSTRNGDVVYPMLAFFFAGSLSWRPLQYGVRFLAAPAILFSFARSAWIATGAFLFNRKRAPLFLLAAFVMIAAVLLLGQGQNLADRFVSIFADDGHASNGERLRILRFAMGRITLLGRGVGQFAGSDARYADLPEIYESENFFVTMAVENGLLAAALFIGLWAWTVKTTPARAFAVALTIFYLMNSEIDSIRTWLLFGMCIQGALNKAAATRPARAWKLADLVRGRALAATPARAAAQCVPGPKNAVGSAS